MNTEKNVLKKSGVNSKFWGSTSLLTNSMNAVKFYIRSGYQFCKDKTHQNIEHK